MSLVTLANVSHSFGTHVVLDGATMAIEAGEKVGLVGRNGSGKTTLMSVMLGRLAPESGAVHTQRGMRVGYLSQDPEFDPNDSVRDAAEGAFEDLHRLHVEQHSLFEKMADASGDDLKPLLRRQAEVEAAIHAAGGYAIDHKIDAMLHGLGFSDDQFTRPMGKLSGGEKGRLGLAKLLLQEPDLLLLDEPTNHLDIAGRQWLEAFLADEYRGAVVVVSHDRWLLDRVVDRIIEIQRGVIREYPGNYHKYVELRRERQLTEARVYDKQQDKIRSEEQFIRRYKAGQRARQARGRETRLERYKRDELVDRPAEMDVLRLALPPASRSGEQVIAARGISKRFGDQVLFADLDISLSRGDRVGIIGPNGVGKTTLARCLLGEEPVDAGTIKPGSRLSVGHYRQLHDHLDQSLPVWQYLQSVIVSLDGTTRASEQQARDLAGAFLFSGDEQEKALASLSGGERSRAVLAGLVAGAHNVLVLDEPSNHLDIPSAERLEGALSLNEEGGGYEGTLLLISHDRALLEATCDRLIVFEGGGVVREFPGRYSQWEARLRAAKEERQQAETAARPAARSGGRAKSPARAPAPARSAADRKLAALAKMTVEQLELAIEKTEQEIRAIDQRMLEPAVYRDRDKARELQEGRTRLAAELEPLEFEWSRRATEA